MFSLKNGRLQVTHWSIWNFTEIFPYTIFKNFINWSFPISKISRWLFPANLGNQDFWLTLKYKIFLNKQLFHSSGWFRRLRQSIPVTTTQKSSHFNNATPRNRNLCFKKHWFKFKTILRFKFYHRKYWPDWKDLCKKKMRLDQFHKLTFIVFFPKFFLNSQKSLGEQFFYPFAGARSFSIQALHFKHLILYFVIVNCNSTNTFSFS